MTWEEDFLGDGTAELLDDKGLKVGMIRPVGGSWECRCGPTIIAIRPDRESAMVCVAKYVETSK